MKRLIIAILVLVVVMTAAAAVLLPKSYTGSEFYTKTVSIDKTKDVVLNFEGYSVFVKESDTNSVKVKTKVMVNEDEAKTLDCTIAGNSISVNNSNSKSKNIVLYSTWPWLPLMQIKKYQPAFFTDIDANEYDFVVEVPKGTAVNVTGTKIKVDGCTVAYVKGTSAEIEDGILTRDFNEDVGALTVRDCNVPRNIVFKQKYGEIRDNKIID
ncbi:MAG: hypothetical protein Q8920_08710 [Bacillota bacterium]|nr:hypothetical protein [Bacillota bacterium]